MNKLQFVDSASASWADAHRRLSLFRLIIALLILALCHCCPVLAASAKSARKILSMPILFVTDREKVTSRGDHQDFGVQMIEPVDALYYGCQQVKVKVTAKEAEEMENLPDWGWSLCNEKDAKQESELSATPSSATDSAATAPPAEKTAAEISFQNQVFEKEHDFQRLVDTLKKAMEMNKRREFIIFVHGCCIGFKGSMNQAAALEEATRVPVINYAWGSVKGNYGGSTMTLPRSQERFNSLVRRLLKEFPDEKITLAGNSVGNMMIVEYCLETCEHIESRKFDNIILSRADMDAFAFKTQVKYVVRAGKHVCLYVAKNDPQINLSGVLRWFFNPSDRSERVGNTRSAPMFYCNQPVTVYDVTALKLKHIMPHRAISELLNNNSCPPEDSPVYVYTADRDNVVRVVQRPG
ncbi:MAG: alpha/beta hydrolase, partial [Candidatus Melainabacteria bacterium]|nr:alpha/beta hydrolase [Candidatus Melainabacteria bacterium]